MNTDMAKSKENEKFQFVVRVKTYTSSGTQMDKHECTDWSIRDDDTLLIENDRDGKFEQTIYPKGCWSRLTSERSTRTDEEVG